MRAKAMVTNRDGRKRKVEVEVKVKERSVYKGVFTCYILDKHVLEK
jgi:acyl-coenzyme A thioesterase PaaI-like protein